MCFVGAGLSTKFNLPSWTKLVEEIINTSDKSEYKDFLPILNSGLMKPIDILEIMQSEHHAIKKYIFDNFKISEGDFGIHSNMLQLCGQIITTNYDNAFEMASKNKIVPAIYTSDYNVSEINKSKGPIFLNYMVAFQNQTTVLYSIRTMKNFTRKKLLQKKN